MEIFLNDNFEVLKAIKDNQICIKEHKYLNLSQQELADMVHMSKYKTNKILNILMKNNYITKFNNKSGKYALTKKSLIFLKKIDDMRSVLEVK